MQPREAQRLQHFARICRVQKLVEIAYSAVSRTNRAVGCHSDQRCLDANPSGLPVQIRCHVLKRFVPPTTVQTTVCRLAICLRTRAKPNGSQDRCFETNPDAVQLVCNRLYITVYKGCECS